MDDAVVRKFVLIFMRPTYEEWTRSSVHARRAGLMLFLYPDRERDRVTGISWDPDLFVIQPKMNNLPSEYNVKSPIAWRRDFVEKVVALNYVPNLEELPSVRRI